MAGLKDRLRTERIRHFLVALVVTAILGAVEFFAPIDWMVWMSQARIHDRPASGEIVFIGAERDLTDPTNPSNRLDLARLLSGLDEAGADKVILDVILQRRSTVEADQALAEAIEQSGRTYLVRRMVTTSVGAKMAVTLPDLAGSAPQLTAREWVDPFGATWFAHLGWDEPGGFQQSVPAALAGLAPEEARKFRIDYSIDYRSVPSLMISDALVALEEGRGASLFDGRRVVIGNGVGGEAAFASIPGHPQVPISMVAILAAETLRIGPPRDHGWAPTFIIFVGLLLGVLALTHQSKTRRWGYAIVAASIPVWYLLSLELRIIAHLSVPLAFLAVFGSIRLWKARTRRAALVDELSGLPSFRALERDLAKRALMNQLAVVVARIHRFDEVLAILSGDSQGEYVRQIAERFRITEKDLTVYSNGGRYLAWVQEVEDDEHLEAHLKGLRAVFTLPLEVSGTPIDVGITFGADATRESSPARKIASATAAVDRTTEAHAPVLLADAASVSDRMWNVSLQAKIDAALKGGQIYVVYQPQFQLPGERLCGFEALVRWNDPERGPISPSYFIEQCEHAGRMEALTRKVFAEAVETISRSPFAEGPYRLSVNVSATMLGDDRVVDILERTLVASGFDARRITLEITETARIPDFDRARAALTSLQALGVRISIDDFGVGAANLETLLRLPFDELKIDRAFVARIREDTKARHIVQSLINLSRDVGLEVVAEGVEDRFTLEILNSLGCEGVQGYVLGRPGPLSEMLQFQDSTSRRGTASLD